MAYKYRFWRFHPIHTDLLVVAAGYTVYMAS